MKKLLVLVMLCFSAFIAPTQTQAATPPKIQFDNNTSAVLYVYITTYDLSLIPYVSNIMMIPAGVATTFNMYSGGIYPTVSWPGGVMPPAFSEFGKVEYYEYNPTNPSCFPGAATPISSCNFISSSMDIYGPTSTCMETSGSSCATVPGRTVIRGTVSAVYWKSMDVTFYY